MSIKLTWEIVIQECIKQYNGYYKYSINEQPPYKGVDNTSMLVHCPNHGIFEINVGNHKNGGHGCPQCGIEQRSSTTRLGWDDVIPACLKIYNNYYLYKYDEQTIYKNNKTKMVVHCPHHGMFKIAVHKHKNDGQACKECGYTRNGDMFRSNWENIINECERLYGDIYTYDINEQELYVNTTTHILVHCNVHGPFEIAVGNHKNQGQGCRECNFSRGERMVGFVMDNHITDYITQHTYKGCRGDSNPLKFDFYLPEYNILIEYDGIQHFEYDPDFFHKKGYWQFERQQRYDEIKNQYCHDNNIPLIRIPYTIEGYDNIEQYLKQELEKLGVTLWHI